jgi:lycopene elongase/hydratase (flavuxanthin-forming)
MKGALETLGKAVRISRPVFWAAPAAAYTIGVTLAGVERTPFVYWEFLLSTFPLAFAVYFINDYYDMPYDRANPRKGGVWGSPLGKKDAEWGWKLTFFFAFLAIATAISSPNLLHAFFIPMGMAMCYAYSAPPFRLKNRPVLDSLSAAAYFYIPFAAACALGNSYLFLDYRVVLAALLASAAHALSTVVDYKKDMEAGQKTFATVLGMRAPALFAAAVLLSNVLFVFPFFSPFTLGLWIAAVLSILLAVFPSPKNTMLALKALLAYALLAGYFFLGKYVLFAKELADYKEPEFALLLDGCGEGRTWDAPEGICWEIERLEAACANGSESAAMPNSCRFLEAHSSRDST